MKNRLQLSPSWHYMYPNEPGMTVCSDFSFIAFGGGAHTIPAGFWYNGASIPALFWQLIYSPFDPRILEAACIHDWLYTNKAVGRSVADATLRMYIQINCRDKIKPAIVQKAVAMFGGGSWKDSPADKTYLNRLRHEIAESGRSLTAYGLS